jgi:hypothetical protein
MEMAEFTLTLKQQELQNLQQRHPLCVVVLQHLLVTDMPTTFMSQHKSSNK